MDSFWRREKHKRLSMISQSIKMDQQEPENIARLKVTCCYITSTSINTTAAATAIGVIFYADNINPTHCCQIKSHSLSVPQQTCKIKSVDYIELD